MTSAGSRWVEGYVHAWETNDPGDIGKLFRDDAIYEFRPEDPEALVGREAIIAGWLDSADTPGEWSFEWWIVSENPDVVVVQGRTDYPAGKLYDNLWVILLDSDGRAGRFTEWYMERPR